ncbi:MAG: hypothetical protein K0M55_08725 [Rhizobium sp.]|nr:hypothetical protein [Rhizobium sp.]
MAGSIPTSIPTSILAANNLIITHSPKVQPAQSVGLCLPSHARQGVEEGVDIETKEEQYRNITGKERAMTDILRDVAAFASISMFVASLSVIMLAL